MNINRYKKLKEAIEVNTFEKSYTFIDKVLYGFAILAHLASIVFGYIFVADLLNSSTDEFWGKIVIIPVITVISLASFELLKRFLFRQTTMNYFIKGGTTKEVIGTALLSLLLIVLTFYLSLNGAENMGDRSNVIESNTEVKINSKTDSITKIYDGKIAKLENSKNIYLGMITTGTRSRELRTQYNGMIETADKDIKALEAEKENRVKQYQNIENQKASVKKKEVVKNIFSFIIISSFIEIIILIGVWFDAYYDYRSFNEFSERVQNQNNYKKFLTHERLLGMVFSYGKVKIADTLDSSKTIKKLATIKGFNVTEKQISDFFTLTKYLGITTTEANRRVVQKGYDEAKKLMIEYYNVDSKN